MRSKAAVVLLALAGCSGGCDGERAKPPVGPKPIGAARDAAFVSDAREPVQAGYLDVPDGSLEQLFRGLDAAEKQQTNGRVLMAFFGDSHTASDSMTSRVRHTFQERF